MRESKPKDETKGTILRLRLTSADLREARLAAKAEAGGNVSEFVRRAMREKIHQLLAA